MKANPRWMTLFSLLMITALAACGAKATPAAAPAAVQAVTTAPLLVAGEVTSPVRTLEDIDSSLRASEKRAISGDTFLNNLYERPFTAKEMIYQPDINIKTVSISGDSKFYYFTITLQGFDATTNALTGTYGIEFDRTKTGKGDLLVQAHDLKEEWSTQNVKVYNDLNKDVGGYKPIVAEQGFGGDGYESEVKMEGDNVAYARSIAGDTPEVQIAVSHALLGDAAEFLWGGWADKGVNDPKKFDYDDFFGPSAAGSPIKTSSDYPLKALYSVDNTCRLPYGFEPPQGTIPGMCLTIPPAASGCACSKAGASSPARCAAAGGTWNCG